MVGIKECRMIFVIMCSASASNVWNDDSSIV